MKTILVVDDSPTIQRTLSFMLRRMGHNALTARNGLEALSQLEANQVDIIITDINMPEMDGLTLMHTVRERAHLRHIPIVLLTDSGEWQQDGRSLDADAFLTKPISSHQLMGKISNLSTA
jgi:two-component system chemotaxis response regulator CheY